MLAERDHLLRAARTVLTSGTSGQLGVLLAGQSGIGATSLLREIAASLADDGLAIADWHRLPRDHEGPESATPLTVALVDDVARIGPDGEATLYG
jgi:hypothetical protein